ncbi:glycosyltransferase [Rhodospirillum sp. A1_3_36]|uniref:glycosyltransferase n=1 Tax=Rhodospirillum sp. A1_3_36 TaxID=3391666 RepID=UPI0039A6B9F1
MKGRVTGQHSMRNGEPYDVAVISTAALPWRTGPSYFSLWHAAGLKAMGLSVIYVVPWVEPACQRLWGEPIYRTFAEQAEAMHLEADRIGCPPLPDIVSYKARVWWLARSIVPMVDVFRVTPPARALVLHEPEHLAWLPWTTPRRRLSANRVLGIVMTNYEDYVRSAHANRGVPQWLARGASRLVTRYHRSRILRHTDIAVPLSGAVREVVDIGDHMREARVTGVTAPWVAVPPVGEDTKAVYFLGRLIWEKGLADVIEVSKRSGLAIDVIGDGADKDAVHEKARAEGAPLTFLGPSAEPWTLIAPYRVFFNPSRSEVLCTTTAEALVAGRHVVIPECPANVPFRAYPNTHFFTDTESAITALHAALAEPPAPPDAVRRDFDWRQACRTVAALCELEIPHDTLRKSRVIPNRL